MGKKKKDNRIAGYDRGVLRVIALACVLIVFSMLLIGSLVYRFTEKEMVDKLKEKDIITIADMIASKVDGRILRAKETSLVLAHDPTVKEWVLEEERDQQLGEAALHKMGDLADSFDYTNAFIVSALTGHYWSEEGVIIDTMTRNDPDDDWFFASLQSAKPVQIDIDYNAERQDTFVFVNALLGDIEAPSAVVGVGLSLSTLSSDFQAYKYGEDSKLWMIGQDGVIDLSDHAEHNGRHIDEFLPAAATERIFSSDFSSIEVLEYESHEDQIYDLVVYPLESTEARILFQINRSETVSFLENIKINTGLSVIISLVFVIFFFYYISKRLANPYQQALAYNRQLEQRVAERTRELSDRNEEIMDGIRYAQRIQETVLPTEKQLESMFAEHFLLWSPRDVVGGDFIWVSPTEKGCIVGVGDCTGHGVPGAVMTMLSISALNRITAEAPGKSPAAILTELNRMMKQMLHQEFRNEGKLQIDDGLDIGLCLVEPERIVYAGAGLSLYLRDSRENIRKIEGERRSIGYRRTPLDYSYVNHEIEVGEGICCYMSTDGLFDQNGGENDYAYGRSRFLEWMKEVDGLPLNHQKQRLLENWTQFKKQEDQRDDVTVFAFVPKQRHHG